MIAITPAANMSVNAFDNGMFRGSEIMQHHSVHGCFKRPGNLCNLLCVL
ncbi:Uncharacterised protein [Klebsiella pneumoniae]|nr:Uncharacterised protein [Klebsiella pneumoniae]